MNYMLYQKKYFTGTEIKKVLEEGYGGESGQELACEILVDMRYPISSIWYEDGNIVYCPVFITGADILNIYLPLEEYERRVSTAWMDGGTGSIFFFTDDEKW